MLCKAGIHDMADPANLAERKSAGRVYRQCRQCKRQRDSERQAKLRQLEWRGPRKRKDIASWRKRRGRSRGKTGQQLKYRPTPEEVRTLQAIALGATYADICEAEFCTRSLPRNRMENVRIKYGVNSNAAAVAQGLKRGVIRADREGAKNIPASPWLRSRKGINRHAASVIALVQGKRRQYGDNTHALRRELDVLCAWSEAHAVSVLWAAGLITSRHVPQTRNRYRGTDRTERGVIDVQST